MPILKRTPLLLAAALALAAARADAQFLRVPPAAPGKDFPAIKVTLLNLKEPERSVVRDLRSLADGETSVLFYWVPENKRSEGVLAEVRLLADEIGSGLRVFAVAALTPGITKDKIVARARAIGIEFPVLVDDGYQIAQALQIMTVPSFSVLDKKGVLRLRGAQSLLQPVDGKTTLSEYLRAAAGGKIATVEKLEFYHPAVENVGKRFTDFRLPAWPNGGETALSELVEPGKITAVFFWSPTCPHCKDALPTIAKAREKYKSKMNFVSVTQLPTQEMKEACADVVKAFRIDFPILVDEGGDASSAYKVVSTPTTVVIQPNGSVSGCYFSGEADYVQLLGAEIGKIARP